MLELIEPPTGASASQAPRRLSVASRTRTDQRLFARCAAGDRRARDELVERFLPLARSVARRYEHSGESFDDLLQVASLALVKAVDRYDPRHGAAFSSYAVPSIVGELKRHFRDRTWAVRPPRGLQELTLRVERAVTQLSQELDRAPTVSELAVAIGGTNEQVLEAMQARSGRGALSLQAPAGAQEEQPALQDTLGGGDDGYERAEARALLDGLMNGLPRRSRYVLKLRFEEDMTQAEIGALLGVSQMQVSRIIRQAIAQLRTIADHQTSIDDERAADRAR